MDKLNISNKKKIIFYLIVFQAFFAFLIFRVFFIQFIKDEEYQKMAYEQQTRDRLISPKRGEIVDRNNNVIATNESVYSISVINSQIKEPEKVATLLSEKLELKYEDVLKKVNKKVALERIKTKVDKETADAIRNLNLDGVMIDEDIKRIYPNENMASQVIGFVGKDNQGIIGLEAKYDEYLKGKQGKILTETDSRGIEINNGNQERVAPTNGYTLVTSIDINMQKYAEQTLEKVVEAKGAKRGAIVLMNPQNGEIYAMANKPDFNLNEPFTINDEDLKANWDNMSEKDKNNALNQMWRNFSINDTYEPGSTFKVLTSAMGLEEGIITPETHFNCSGGKTVAGRYIKCWRSPRSHGSQTFAQGVQNSCNPVFMEIGEKLGADKFYEYMQKFGFNEKTGVDLPGEAVGIMHKKENVGPVELATMSFGQSFQITPLQLLRAISSVINGGELITPHFGTKILDENGEVIEELKYDNNRITVSKETSKQMKWILESVVSEGTGNKAYIAGFRIGGKTATSEKLPRRTGKYIASFCAFAPAENPQVIALVLVDEPQGVYYGGQKCVILGQNYNTLLN
ncbi:peptidoglycan D,D-transpeptidase FtsI family protein [[Clostridium] colinum]|uniref:peptidoglycan D,D-transpeptidase FtsI family protein n=1 Tax=[Clostridium] colinum TaxID=36835 RepID=UPI002023F06D|nr:penicillin-binding transpeptidase domain-containing protein [[Clostridium] colinum]